jgi:hypothetical protein
MPEERMRRICRLLLKGIYLMEKGNNSPENPTIEDRRVKEETRITGQVGLIQQKSIQPDDK